MEDKTIKRPVIRNKQSKASIPARALYSNPLDRLCSLLLNWELDDFGGLTGNSIISSMQSIPIIFPNFQTYVESWEPLLIIEMKSCIISNSTFQSSSTGAFNTYIQDGDEMHAPLLRLHCEMPSDNPMNARYVIEYNFIYRHTDLMMFFLWIGQRCPHQWI
jgi:hypothetical protein